MDLLQPFVTATLAKTAPPPWLPLATQIKNNEITLLNVVEALGAHLVSTDNDTRSRATSVLAELLQELRDTKLPPAQTTVLLTFFSDRMADAPTLQHTLRGIYSLLQYQTVLKDDVSKVVKRYFADVQLQSYTKGIRHAGFKLMETLCVKYETLMKNFGDSFVFGFITCADGEKDPQNIKIMFHTVQYIVRNFTLSDTQYEELYEITSCYFPITFTAPAQDPNAVKPDELRESLRQVLSSTPAFSKFAMVLLLDKLSAMSPVETKLDVLKTLTVCIPVYGPKVVSMHLKSLWQGISREAFNSGDAAVEQAASEAFAAITLVLSRAVVDVNSTAPLDEFLGFAINDCMKNIQAVEQKLARPSARLLSSALACCDSASMKICSTVFPSLTTQYMEATEGTKRKMITELLVDFIKPLNGVAHSSWNINPEGLSSEHPLAPYKDQIIALLVDNLMTGDTVARRENSIAGILSLLQHKYLLTQQDKSVLIGHLANTLVKDPVEMVRTSALNAVCTAFADNAKLVKELVVGPLFDSLAQHSNSAFLINAAATLASESESLLEEMLPRLLGNLKTNALNTTAVLEFYRSFSTIISLRRSHTIPSQNLIPEALGKHLIALTVEQALSVAAQSIPLHAAGCLQPATLQEQFHLFAVIMQSVPEEQALRLFQLVCAVFVEGRLDILELSGQFSSLLLTQEPHFGRTAAILAAVVGNAPASFEIPRQTPNQFLSALVAAALAHTDGYARTYLAQCAGGFLNKQKLSTEPVSAEVDQILNLLLSETMKGNQNALHTLSWILKGLVMTNDARAFHVIEKLTSLFSSSNLSKDFLLQVALQFDTVLGETTHILCKESRAIVRPLYKQRCFLLVKPILVQGFQNDQSDRRDLYLLALSHFLQNAPKQVVINELKVLLPLLLESLKFQNDDLVLTTLQVLQSSAIDAGTVLIDQVSSLVPSLLRLSQYKNGHKVQTRIAALQILSTITAIIPYHNLHPLRQDALAMLGKMLDDPKRLVRTEAVSCRNKWFLLGHGVKK